MATKKTVKKKVQYLGTGRRKTAVARVRLIPGEGNITINKRTFEDYFPLDTMRLIVNQPLEAVGAKDKCPSKRSAPRTSSMSSSMSTAAA